MDATNPKGCQNERELWHGFSVDALDSICNYGFNRGYCGKNGKIYHILMSLFIGNLYIFPLISSRDVFSINTLTIILKIISQSDVSTL
jgi:hypothetical protein